MVPPPRIAQVQERLLVYLRTTMKNAMIEYIAPLKQLQGGFETTLYHFQLQHVSEEYTHPMVVRLFPKGDNPQEVFWESTIQNSLVQCGYPAAKVQFICSDPSILGNPFFIMDLLPGKPVSAASPAEFPTFLGIAHADLHTIDPTPVRLSLEAHGFMDRMDSPRRYESRLQDWAAKAPWIRESIDWLHDHQPETPAQEALCHGDFHINNILFENDQVTGVVDWGGFTIADPLYDIANTVILTKIVFKHLAEISFHLPPLDWDDLCEQYLTVYRSLHSLDMANLAYHQVQRCVFSLIQGAEGHRVWLYPPIEKDLIRLIAQTTGVQVQLLNT